GNQHEFVISLEKLHLKTGSTALLKMFRHNLKQLAQTNDLPDYEVLYDPSSDKVTFKNRNQNTPKADASRKREKGKKEIFKIKNHLKK
ncbi:MULTISPECIES: replication initiator protein A, partial [Arsenophonus]